MRHWQHPLHITTTLTDRHVLSNELVGLLGFLFERVPWHLTHHIVSETLETVCSFCVGAAKVFVSEAPYGVLCDGW